MPRSLVVTLWLATLLDSSLASYVFAQEPTSPTQSFENEQASDNLFEVAPTVHPNPIRRAPLIAIVEFESSQPVVPSLIISDGQREWEQPWSSTPSRRHRLAALGLRPNRQHTIRVKVVSADQASQLSLPLTFVTPPLPDNFPPLRTVVSQPDRMEPGLTLFSVNLWRDSVSLLDYGYLIALDAEGEVVWYCHVKDRVADMRILENGHILYQHGNYRYAYEIDILGRDVRRWYADNLTEAPDEHAIAVDVDTMHHDLFQVPGGNLFTLATELVEFDKFPSSEHDPQAPWQPAHVVCDAVVEFNPTNGQIVDQLHLLDVLDPQRFGYMALSGFWKDKYNARIDGKSRDWCHANALHYLADEDAILVSLRHLDCVIKIDWKTKQIIWIVGDPSGWGARWQPYLLKSVGELQWFYHQHSPQLTPRGTLLMFDNGNYRARPFAPPTPATENYSRIVEYEIDEQAKTVKQVFNYAGEPNDRFYSPFYGDADWLPLTENILVTDGGHIESDSGIPQDDVPGEHQWARIFELTRDEQPDKIFEVVCDSGLGSKMGWSIFRASRIVNLIAPFAIDPPAIGEEVLLFTHGAHRERPVEQ